MTGHTDEKSVFWLFNQGKHVCYFSEMDPFAGKWLCLSPNRMADRAIDQLKVLSLIFHHVIFPPGYLLKNPAAWMVFHRLKPLFERGCISISVDNSFRHDPWGYYERKIEEEVYDTEFKNDPALSFFKDTTKTELKQILDNGYFLFRENIVQIKGFGGDAGSLIESYREKSDACSTAFIDGVERLKDMGLISSRDDWMALLYHPAYRPPPTLINDMSAFIHNAYFQQGWIGNHCVMYPSDFIIATQGNGDQTFPPAWLVYHTSVISYVLENQGVDVKTLLNIPLNKFVDDIVLSPAFNIWKEEYHRIAQMICDPLANLSCNNQHSQWADIWNPVNLSNCEISDWGKRIGDLLLKNLPKLGPPMVQAINHLRSILQRSSSLANQSKALEKKAIRGIPGASILDIQSRVVCGWSAVCDEITDKFVISFYDRSIKAPSGQLKKMDRAPFLLLLALLQKHGEVLERGIFEVMAERISREDLGPVMLYWMDSSNEAISERPIVYAETNRIVNKLRSDLKDIGLDKAIETKKGLGWRILVDTEMFVFGDVPTSVLFSEENSYIKIDIQTRTVSHKMKEKSLDKLPFELFQLMIRYGGAPVSAKLISQALSFEKEGSTQQINNRIRKHIEKIRKAIAAIEADVELISDYGIGWRLAPKIPSKARN